MKAKDSDADADADTAVESRERAKQQEQEPELEQEQEQEEVAGRRRPGVGGLALDSNEETALTPTGRLASDEMPHMSGDTHE